MKKFLFTRLKSPHEPCTNSTSPVKFQEICSGKKANGKIWWAGLLAILLHCCLVALFLFPSPVQAQSAIITEEFIEEFATVAAEAAQKYGGQVAAYEIWNEEDLVGPSSLYVPPEDYALLLEATYEAIKTNSFSRVIVGGLASGDINYLTTISQTLGGRIPADGIGVHPYVLDMDILRLKLNQYLSVSQGKPLWVTEFGWETPNQQDQADYLRNAFDVFRSFGGQVPLATWYCWSDIMNPGFGLVDRNGNPKLAYYNFHSGEGINLDPRHGRQGAPTAAELQDLGAGWVRMVYRPLVDFETIAGINFDSLIQEYSSAGIKILLILNQETLSPEIGPGPAAEPITISGASHVCSDFIEERKETSGTTEYIPLIPLSLLGTSRRNLSKQSIGGNISLEEIKFPHFEIFQNTMSSALPKLLPQELAQNISLPGNTKMYFKHFAQGQNEAGEFDPSLTTECDETPEGEVTVPANVWGRLAGAVRGLCGFLGVGICQPVANFQFQLAEVGYSCDLGSSCSPGEEIKPKKLSKPEPKKTAFSVLGLIREIIETLENIIGNILERITDTTRHKKVKFLSRSKLPGGSETVRNSEFFYSFLPSKIIKTIEPRDEARALEDGFRYSVSFSPVESGEQKGEYYKLRKARNAYCLSQCRLYPPEKNNFDEICPSCDPEYYKSKRTKPCDPPWELDPSDPKHGPKPPECHWDKWLCGCDYYSCKIGEPDCERGCGGKQDPLCENGVCGWKALYLPKDACDANRNYCDSKSCFGISGGNPCKGESYTLGAPKCERVHFNLSPGYESGPPYGKCYYLNPDVSLRKNRPGGLSGCNYGCNWACHD